MTVNLYLVGETYYTESAINEAIDYKRNPSNNERLSNDQHKAFIRAAAQYGLIESIETRANYNSH